MKRSLFFFKMLFYLGIIVWLGGFIIFQQYIRKHPIDEIKKTDAIVVLTGGKNRITEAVRLYNNDLSNLLFISGVDPHVGLKTLQAQNNVVINQKIGRVILGKEATNTIENAIEVTDMIRRYHVKSIRLVTSYYHMPRSLEEISVLNPNVEILAHPVFSKNVAKRWWKRPKSFCLIASEYHKFVFVYLKHFFLKLTERN